jgi:hypothetical protein
METTYDHFERKILSWVAKLLTNLILTSIPMAMLSFYKIPTGVRTGLDFFRSRFSGKGMNTRESIDLLGGTLFVDPKIRKDLE